MGAGSPQGGRPEYQPTDADRQTVIQMARVGIVQEDIAKCIGTDGIAPKTLRKHFRKELDTAALHANSEVANSLYRQAVGKHGVIRINADGSQEMIEAPVPPVPSAGIWWSKARMGWKEQIAPVVDTADLAKRLHEARKEIEATDGPDGSLDEA